MEENVTGVYYKEEFSRTASMLGEDGMRKLSEAHVAVFGVGGVGGYIVEALVRSGVGRLSLIDGDAVSTTNINRQIIALQSTLDMPKTLAARNRALDINPDCRITEHRMFFMPDDESSDALDFSEFSYVADAVDSVAAKAEIVRRSKLAGVRVISSMGAANRLDPTRLRVADIYETSVCPLARAVRARLRKMGIDSLKCVFSSEPPFKEGQAVPPSNAFVPPAAGLIIASEIVRDIVYGR